VGPAKGHVTAIYNGKVFQGDPRNIPLTAHAQIQPFRVGRTGKRGNSPKVPSLQAMPRSAIAAKPLR
jgi:hypothetical protein